MVSKLERVSVGERSVTVPDPVDQRRWARSYGTYIAGRSYLDEVDALAAQMELKWGVGRLRLLVPPDMRERFDRQRYLLNQAIWHGQDLEQVKVQSARMCRAWCALNDKAEELGARPLDPECWEVAFGPGAVAGVAIICRDGYDASKVDIAGRCATVYTLEEIARLLELFPTVAAVKKFYPGARVEAVRHTVQDPLDAFPGSERDLDAPLVEDEIPW
jgi:hypothetical protein